MKAHIFKSFLLVLGFLSINAFCAQPNAHDNDQAHNQQRDARYDRCNRECNRFCNAHGQKFLLLIAAGAIGLLLSPYIPSISSSGNHFNSTATVPPHAQPHATIKSYDHNLSAQAALFNFKNARFKSKPNDSQRNKRKNKRK